MRSFMFATGIENCAESRTVVTERLRPPHRTPPREGRHVARNMVNVLIGRTPTPFHYEPLGELLLIGRHSGVARIRGVEMAGFPAWFLWRSVYLLRMPQTSQRFRIAFDYLLDMAFGRNLADVS